MNKKIYIVLATLLLLATISSFTINVKGDTDIKVNTDTNVIINNINSNIVLTGFTNSVSVSPSSVPRYCDVTVMASPGTIAKVYRVNNVYTGISCVVNDEGYCSFKFSLKESIGLYYVEINNTIIPVFLNPNPNNACDLTYKTDMLEVNPNEITLMVGTEFNFTVNAYKNNLSIDSVKEYELTNYSVANITYYDNNVVTIYANAIGETKLIVSSGMVQNESNIKIIPNSDKPGLLNITNKIDELYAGESWTFSIELYDVYGNLIIEDVNYSGDAIHGNVNVSMDTFTYFAPTSLNGSSTLTDTLTINYGNVTDSFNITIKPSIPLQVPTSIICTASPPSIYVDEESLITCTIYDEENVIIEGVLVEFFSTGGVLFPTKATTSSDGKVMVTFNSSSEGIFEINSTCADIWNIATISVTTPEIPGIYYGSVLDTNGNPIPNTNITILLNGAFIKSINVNESGNFNFELEPGIYDVIVQAPGYLTVYDYGLVIISNENVTKNYVLTTLSRLSGVITNQTNDTISDATIEIYRNNKMVNSMLTGSDGKYEFTIASGVYTVKVIKEEYIPSFFSLYIPSIVEMEKDVTIYRR